MHLYAIARTNNHRSPFEFAPLIILLMALGAQQKRLSASSTKTRPTALPTVNQSTVSPIDLINVALDYLPHNATI